LKTYIAQRPGVAVLTPFGMSLVIVVLLSRVLAHDPGPAQRRPRLRRGMSTIG